MTFKAALLRKENLTADVRLLSFKVPKEFSFRAGQFVSLILKKDEVQKPRSYSILSPPSQSGKIDLCIKVVTDGFASGIFEQMKIDEEVTVKGPFGHFVFDERTENEHWFIGGGTGLAPLYSMICEHLSSNPTKKFKLIIGYKTKSDLLFHEQLLSLEGSYSNFDYIPTLSREAWSGKTGHTQDHLPEDLQNKTFYICGLKELVLDTQKLLLNKGVKPENIKFERYT